MRGSLLAAAAAALLVPSLLAVPPVSATTAPATAAPEAAYDVTTLHFQVTVGPDDGTTCDVVGDLYRPRTASPRRRVPAVLTTNGFGGSKDDQAGMGAALAERGYAVLSYSGLGFGGSGCRIRLDDPDWDGKAARQLVSYLGGADGIAYLDASHTEPAPTLDVVKLDRRDHRGARSAHDPRVGMIGGSYGGGVQFAAAAVDPRIDTIVPMITWNDLSYSLAPNNTTLDGGVRATTPGAVKLVWGLGFSALGAVAGLQNLQGDPARIAGCPNFAGFVCPALVTGASTGYFGPRTVRKLRHASATSVIDRIRIPTLLLQGQHDTLFNLNEAVATYRALRQQGTPVKMVWHSWGHSGPAAPGEFDMAAPDPTTQHETRRILDWFAHYLKDRPVSTGPRFSYFRPWVPYDGIATPAYAASDRFPVGDRRTWFLSGRDRLQPAGGPARPGAQRLLTPPAGLPTTLDTLDAVGSLFSGDIALTGQSVPGTVARWQTTPLTEDVDVAGIPRVRLRVQAPLGTLTELLGPAGQLVLFVKVVDVAPDGTRRMIKDTIAPVRIPDAGAPFTVDLPGIVHRFEAGHRIGLVVAGGSANYRGNTTPFTVTIRSGTQNTLALPVVTG